MKEYRFFIYLYSDGIVYDCAFQTIYANNYLSACKQLGSVVPHNFSCDSFTLGTTYRVNGKTRRVR